MEFASIVKKSKPDKNKIHPAQDLNQPGQCHAFIPQKNRYCRLQAKKGTVYCGEHRIFDKEGNAKRVLCHCNSTFGIWEIEKHVKLHCPFRPKIDEPYYELNSNDPSGNSESIDSSATEAKLSTYRMGVQEFTSVSQKLSLIWKTLGSPIFETRVKKHDGIKEFVEKCETGKHSKQISSILGHLQELDLLNDPSCCFQEWGCGKAEVTRWIAHQFSTKSLKGAQYLLIDRSKAKLKLDKAFKKENQYQRILVDIKDLNLTKVKGVLEYPAVAFSKHLCGSATDLTLSCLSDFQRHEKAAMKGLFIALCCHQVCTFSRYINHDFLKRHEINEQDFYAIRKITTWGVCGKRPQENDPNSSNESHWTGLSFQEREQLGFMAKRILDLGRVEYIKDKMKAKTVGLVYYIEKKSTLENMALYATF